MRHLPGSSACRNTSHSARLVVVTGGPGAGKTAVLEVARRSLCEQIAVVPEAASILFGGGFWRRDTLPARKGAQRAIFHVQRQLERVIEEEGQTAIALCDRGTLDGLAYWPEDQASFFDELRVRKEEEFSRYAAVIHMRTPSAGMGYNHSNPVRTESATEAARADDRIARAWDGHPRRFFIESSEDFLSKAKQAIEIIRAELPDCCKNHRIAWDADGAEGPPKCTTKHGEAK